MHDKYTDHRTGVTHREENHMLTFSTCSHHLTLSSIISPVHPP